MHPTAKRQKSVVSSLDAAIVALDIAEKASGITPAKAAFSVVKEILTMVKVVFPSESASVDYGLKCGQDSMMNEGDYVELGLACASVRTILNRGLSGKQPSELNTSVYEAIEQLTT